MIELTPSKWTKKEDLFAEKDLNQNTLQWLTKTPNLTETIKQTGSLFSLKLLGQGFDTIYCEEKSALELNSASTNYFVRKVFLEGDGTPVIFARVVVPEPTYFNYIEAFNSLGNAPIGNTILYADEKIKRGAFEYRLVESNENLFREINTIILLPLGFKYWSRRSLFSLPKGTLLITEVFLEPLLRHPTLNIR